MSRSFVLVVSFNVPLEKFNFAVEMVDISVNHGKDVDRQNIV